VCVCVCVCVCVFAMYVCVLSLCVCVLGFAGSVLCAFEQGLWLPSYLYARVRVYVCVCVHACAFGLAGPVLRLNEVCGYLNMFCVFVCAHARARVHVRLCVHACVRVFYFDGPLCV